MTKITLLDGGMGQELIHRAGDRPTPLWSTQVMMDHPGMVEAVTLVARLEGLLLDPVYSGKAMAGLIDLISRGHFGRDDNVVFIHTGGAVGLFGYPDAFGLPGPGRP